MIPKVASHILHSSTRAAAVVQNQTFRNVLQFQPNHANAHTGLNPVTGSTSLSSHSNAGSSSWGGNGSNGPGSGGSRFNNPGAGGRFQFDGAPGRAVTQAHTITLNNDTTFQPQDDEIPSLDDPKVRDRSRPASTTTALVRTPRLGVSSAVLSVSRHAFTRPQLLIEAHPRLLHTDIPAARVPVYVQTHNENAPEVTAVSPSLTRRNSTASTVRPPSPRPALSRRNSTASMHAFEPVSSPPPASLTTPLPPSPASSSKVDVVSDTYERLHTAATVRDPLLAAEAVRTFLQEAQAGRECSAREYNAALHALLVTRPVDEPLTNLTNIYASMTRHSVAPNLNTYLILIEAFTRRDAEVAAMTRRLEGNSHMENISKRLRTLAEESNLMSAMHLFQTLVAMGSNKRVPPETYTSLLRTCALHGAVDFAIQVFGQMERYEPSYVSPGSWQSCNPDMDGVNKVFQEYSHVCQQESPFPVLAWDSQSREQHVQIYNLLIEAYFRTGLPDKAVGVVEAMLDASANGVEFQSDCPPPTADSTFSTVITGFTASGDLASAKMWFERLLAQPSNPQGAPHRSSESVRRPDGVTWRAMIEALADDVEASSANGLCTDNLALLNDYFRQYTENDSIPVQGSERRRVFNANINSLQAPYPAETVKSRLDFVCHVIIPRTGANGELPRIRRSLYVKQALRVAEEYYRHGFVDDALDTVAMTLGTYDNSPYVDAHFMDTAEFLKRIVSERGRSLTFEQCMAIARLHTLICIPMNNEDMQYLLHSYGVRRAEDAVFVGTAMTSEYFSILLLAATCVEPLLLSGQLTVEPGYALIGIEDLLRDMARAGYTLETVHPGVLARLASLLGAETSVVAAELDEIRNVAGLPPSFAQTLKSTGSVPPLRLHVSEALTKRMDQILQGMILPRANYQVLTDEALALFRKSQQQGKVPTVRVIGRLIEASGRVKDISAIREMYSLAQMVKDLHTADARAQRERERSWFVLENAMILGLAHAGDFDAAMAHRQRILDHGGYPSAEAYAALILHVRDTTDDASTAIELFEEWRRSGLPGSVFLYNNIISKLAKARRADHALEIFAEMKALGRPPSSITYGALIGACARVGDVESGETLFQEMEASPSFKPKIPPYNMMMQLYTTIKPNRERALMYYEKMRAAQIKPSEHTYKLLLDAYGNVEPVDVAAMERTFQALVADKRVVVQGPHFASLITSYGCVQKNLEKALAVFDSISHYAERCMPGIPDALVYEAIFDVLVTHKRSDLFPKWIQKMSDTGVHMTAYVANFIIKGYAVTGHLDEARQMFESMQDPPMGVAAPHNHVEKTQRENGTEAHILEPVYREPSTWEAMVRAELGVNNREAALDLLERLKARQYPEAVYNRISGILLDHTQIPL
ncbi:hypothetical protein FISHEDRAFT_49778 [Fistulina hepatica ATCC 64428]|uniref:PROP1-like PPR domain-containing protein n=1 Tax=Fistulina hepatica ATCC 64428 TaxID=1128425 RepID=A0A0D7A441_9AGAR|nr:hypothetical protein FISHEDRAFT_49778 [Fistulina hepatica ATCC 64428]